MTLSVLSCSLPLLICLTTLGEDEPGTDKKSPSLEGIWAVKSAVVEGNALPAEVTTMMQLKMRGGRYEAQVGENVDRGSYKVNDEKKPRWMDVTGVEGANKGKTFLAIYDWQDNKLRICYSLVDGKRPSKIDSTLSGQMLIVYKKPDK